MPKSLYGRRIPSRSVHDLRENDSGFDGGGTASGPLVVGTVAGDGPSAPDDRRWIAWPAIPGGPTIRRPLSSRGPSASFVLIGSARGAKPVNNDDG